MSAARAAKTAKAVAYLFSIYRQQTSKWSDADAGDTTRAYTMALADIDADELADAVRRAVATHKFLPSVAELREECAKVATAHVDAGEAWAEVLNAVSKYGRYRTPVFSTQLITKAVAAVGWQSICDSEMVGVERSHFRKAYEEAQAFLQRAGQLGDLLTEQERTRLQGLHDKETKPLPSGPRSLRAILGGEE